MSETIMTDSTTGGLLWATGPKSEREQKVQPHPGEVARVVFLSLWVGFHPLKKPQDEQNGRCEDWLNLASRREIPTHSLQMKSGLKRISPEI